MICPMMSRPVTEKEYSHDGIYEDIRKLFEVECLEEKCRAYVPAKQQKNLENIANGFCMLIGR